MRICRHDAEKSGHGDLLGVPLEMPLDRVQVHGVEFDHLSVSAGRRSRQSQEEQHPEDLRVGDELCQVGHDLPVTNPL